MLLFLLFGNLLVLAIFFRLGFLEHGATQATPDYIARGWHLTWPSTKHLIGTALFLFTFVTLVFQLIKTKPDAVKEQTLDDEG